MTSDETLVQAKMRFLASAKGYEPLGIIKRNPLKSIGCAFLLGISAYILHKKMPSGAVIPLLLDASELALRLGLNSNK